jgi:hypothetical protein
VNVWGDTIGAAIIDRYEKGRESAEKPPPEPE